MLGAKSEFNAVEKQDESGRSPFRLQCPNESTWERPTLMPIYEYQTTGSASCPHCREGFDLLRKLNDPPVISCPECGAPVERKISAPHLNTAGPSMSESNIEKHGFTQYRKVEKGVYEKTTGKGPDFISKD